MDGESCFYVLLVKSKLSKMGFAVQLQFIISQHSRDRELMNRIKVWLNCGYIKDRVNQDCVDFVITKFSDHINILIPFLQKYTLCSAKYREFQDFKQVAEIMKNKGHLTKEGLEQISKIKSNMNKNRLYTG